MYTINDQTKVMTEQRLKIDIVETKCEGLLADIRHLEVQLKESNEFKELYDVDNIKLREDFTKLLEKHNIINAELSGFHVILETQNEKLSQQKDDITRLTDENYDLTATIDSMNVELQKMNEWYKNTKADLDETIDRLHLANRVRHELELRLHAELDANYRLQRTIDEKIFLIKEFEDKMDYMDLQVKQA